jgi:hypothetical protein
MVGPAGDVSSRRGSFARRVLAGLVVVVTLTLLAGCGVGLGSTSASRGQLLSTLENWSSLETPVDQARGLLTQECMARHGLPYYPFAGVGQPGGEPLCRLGPAANPSLSSRICDADSYYPL